MAVALAPLYVLVKGEKVGPCGFAIASVADQLGK